MRLRIARGLAAHDLPAGYEDVVGLAVEAQRAVESGADDAADLSMRELEAIQSAEMHLGHRIHKGHPLHNHGVAILGADVEAARTFFHAALVEDIRTESGLTETPARMTLQELYGEPTVMLERLAELAVRTTGDPLSLARRFEKGEELPPYRGFRRKWRPLSALDGIQREALVFVGGAHANPAGIMALRRAVLAENLSPAVVLEFEDFTDNAYEKSKTIMSRCSLVLLDVLFETGWNHELHIAAELRLPVFGGYLAWSGGDPPHANAMTKGFEAISGTKLVGATEPETMMREARRWLRQHVAGMPSSAPVTELVSAAGTATPLAISSNIGFADPGGVPTIMSTKSGLAFATSADVKVFAGTIDSSGRMTNRGKRRDPHRDEPL